ncbi:MAG: glycosyltransferase [Planctomycetes bacterium]|nr:glycosyltransferase [Planctomycetota bacterium]
MLAAEISIVVISFNRRDSLRKCLDSLLAMKPGTDWEAVIVDQGSTDGSIELVTQYAQQDSRIRLDVCRRTSLNAKRNRGIQISGADIVAFLDDDCIVDQNWVDACSSAFRGKGVNLVTGQIRPLNKGFKRSIRTSSKRRVWGAKWFDRVICWRCGCGNNFAIRKAVLDRIGWLDEDIGAGTALGGGGDDTEYFYRAMLKGCHIVYTPDMLVYHPQPTAFDDYRRRSQFYYRGVAVFVRKKYSYCPSAILMIAIRLMHSLTFLLLACASLDKEALSSRRAEIGGTLGGLLARNQPGVLLQYRPHRSTER